MSVLFVRRALKRRVWPESVSSRSTISSKPVPVNEYATPPIVTLELILPAELTVSESVPKRRAFSPNVSPSSSSAARNVPIDVQAGSTSNTTGSVVPYV